VDQGVPGRGRTGTLDPDDRDDADCYYFSVCEGQSIQVSLSSGGDFAFELLDHLKEVVASGYTANESARHYVKIFANGGATRDDYTLSITLSGQNDAGTGSDAGNDINQAVSITPGSYSGYMGETDWELRIFWIKKMLERGILIFICIIHLVNGSIPVNIMEKMNLNILLMYRAYGK
jgi:VCBS repeat-containing protein